MIRALFAVLALGSFAAAADPAAAEREFVDRVNKSIERGKRYLISQQNPQGNWDGIVIESLAGFTGGRTALVTLALLTAGEPPDGKVLAPALDYLRNLPPDKTYVVGLTAMVLAEARQAKDRDRIQKLADWLLTNAYKEGGRIRGWSYPGNPTPDGSNTQYALLGLYAAKQAGAQVPETAWVQIREMYDGSQNVDSPTTGSWPYMHTLKDRRDRSFTMTVAGVCGLIIAGMGQAAGGQGLDEATGVAALCGKYDESAPLNRGMNWIAARFSFENAPGSKSIFYNTYGLERLGRLSGERFIGAHDWYREGCEFLLPMQGGKGEWTRNGAGTIADPIATVSTSFAVLFLVKGRTPVLITKLAHGDFSERDGVLLERGDEPGKVGWNRKKNDARHLAEFCSRELFEGRPMGWQVYDPRRANFTPAQLRAEVGTLLASPVMYMNGHKAPQLTGEQKDILKRYVDEGGFLFAEACCGSPEFAQGFEKLMAELFPDNQLVTMPPEHPVWRARFAVSPADFPGLKVLERGCKTVVVFSPVPVAGFWEEARFMPKAGEAAATRGHRAFQLGANVIAYATGMEPPQQRGTVVRVVDLAKADASPPRGAFKPVQLRLRDEAAPAPAAMRNLIAYAKDAARLDAVADKQLLAPGDAELQKYLFVYLHGRKRLNLTDPELDNLKLRLETGGLLLADACCGKPEFDESFRAAVKKMYPDAPLQPVPADDDLYSAALNGAGGEIRTVKRREKAAGAAGDAGFRDLPPKLEGVKIDGRWVILYSPYDIGCALENHKSTDCLGHDRESALRLGTAAILYALKR